MPGGELLSLGCAFLFVAFRPPPDCSRGESWEERPRAFFPCFANAVFKFSRPKTSCATLTPVCRAFFTNHFSALLKVGHRPTEETFKYGNLIHNPAKIECHEKLINLHLFALLDLNNIACTTCVNFLHITTQRYKGLLRPKCSVSNTLTNSNGTNFVVSRFILTSIVSNRFRVTGMRYGRWNDLDTR